MHAYAKILFLLVSLAINHAVFAAESLYTKQPSVMPALAKFGDHTVGVRTLNVTNPEQLSASDFQSIEDRKLTIEVWYPANAEYIEQNNVQITSYKDQTRSGKPFELAASAYRNVTPAAGEQFPLIVLSHGYTGYRTIMFYLAEHLASHGYIVAAIDHTDSTNAEIDFTKNSGAGFASTLLNRARDQQFVLDYFSTPTFKLSEITNSDKAAVIGYSMGGYGAINTIGGCYNFSVASLSALGFSDEQVLNLKPLFNSCNAGRKKSDARWQAMIALAPWGGELNVHSAESLAKIKTPMLFIAGDQDDISGYENGIKKLFDATKSSNDRQNKFLMVYQNARHNIAAHPAPKAAYDNDLDIGHYFEPSWNSETLNRINQHMSLAFLDCYIKRKNEACEMLPNTTDITQTKLENGKLSPAWPGFAERWGTGVKFYRR